MKLALILFGISYAESIQHWTGNLFKVDYKESLINYKKYIWEYFKNYNIDVFFSTYQSEKSKELLNDYKPKAHHFFPKLSYIQNFKRIGKNSNVIKAIELTLNYSKKRRFKYDLCIVTRFDLLFQIPFEKASFNLNMFNNTSELEKHSRICDNFYVMPGHVLDKFFQIIKEQGISSNHHFLKYKLLNHFKINYIYNEHTHISALNFYKINRIPTNKIPIPTKNKPPNVLEENKLIHKTNIKTILINNKSKNIINNKVKNIQKTKTNPIKNIKNNKNKKIPVKIVLTNIIKVNIKN